MNRFFISQQNLCKLLARLVLLTFTLSVGLPLPAPVLAQTVLNLPQPGAMVGVSPGFTPILLKGLKVYQDNPLRLDFIVDTGNTKLQGDALKKEGEKLIKYFLAALTVPQKDLWVNLSPYEKDRIVPDEFGITDMGRDLLAQDYLLKQLTASLIYPEEEMGKQFWGRIYRKAVQMFGSTNVPINTFNKVWIIPDGARIYENGDRAFVVQSHLKVLLEEDYLAVSKNLQNKEIGTDKVAQATVHKASNISSAIVKEMVLPALEKEVNEGKNFVQLRQIYNSVILASWYKNTLQESLLGKVYVNQNKVAGIDLADTEVKQKIYAQYLAAFKKGVYNYIREDYDPASQKMIPRKYFSGGSDMGKTTYTNDGRAEEYGTTGSTVVFEAGMNPSQGNATAADAAARKSPPDQAMLARDGTSGALRTGIMSSDISVHMNGRGAALPSRPAERYIKDRERKEAYLKVLHSQERLIGPGQEDFDKFQDLHAEATGVLQKLLTAQGLDPNGYRLFLTDKLKPNASVMRDYDVVLLNLGALRLLVEAGAGKDALAFVLAHEVTHIQQMRAAIDSGKAAQGEGFIFRTHMKQRAEEYQADLLAITLMDKAGFSVKQAPTMFEGLLQWMKQRKLDRSFWGSHPDIEERLRKLNRLIQDYYWSSYLNTPQEFSGTTLQQLKQRTVHRQFQEKVMQINSTAELTAVLAEARSAEELQFAYLIGYEFLPEEDRREAPVNKLRAVFEQRLAEFSQGDQGRQILNDYMKNEIYYLTSRDERYSNLNGMRQVAAALDPAAMRGVFEAGIPRLFAVEIDVDPLAQNPRHKRAQTAMQYLKTMVTSLSEPGRPSNRFNMYASGLLGYMMDRLIAQVRSGQLAWAESRGSLQALINLRMEANIIGVGEGDMWIASNIYDLVSAILRSETYAPQMNPDDVRLILDLYDYAKSYGTGFTDGNAADELYTLAQRTTEANRQVLVAWALEARQGSVLVEKFLARDIEQFAKTGRAILSSGTKLEYLQAMLSYPNMVKYHHKLFSNFLQAVERSVNDEERVSFHQAILREFRTQGINDDAGVYASLTLLTNIEGSEVWRGDIYEQALLKAVDPALQDMVRTTDRQLKPLMYVFALGGMVKDSELRELLFKPILNRERPDESMFQNPEIMAMVRQAQPQDELDDPEDLPERFRFLDREEQDRIGARWEEINPRTEELRVRAQDFADLVRFFESLRPQIGQRLAKAEISQTEVQAARREAEDRLRSEYSDPEKADIAFGRYMLPIYMQAVLTDRGVPERLRTTDGLFDSWDDAFKGEMMHLGVDSAYSLAEAVEGQRPRQVNRLVISQKPVEDFLAMFAFVSSLPDAYDEAVAYVTGRIPPTVFRNFVLYLLFVDRVLVRGKNIVVAPADMLNLAKMKEHISGLPAQERLEIFGQLQKIISLMNPDIEVSLANSAAVSEFMIKKEAQRKADERKPTTASLPTTLRDDHAAEAAAYAEGAFATPGGPLAQVEILAAGLMDDQMREMMDSAEYDLSSKRAVILKFYPKSSPARDRWLKMALQKALDTGSIAGAEQLLPLFINRVMRDQIGLQLIGQHRDLYPQGFQELDQALTEIRKFFPEASLMRDDVLEETAQKLVNTPSKMARLQAMMLDPFKKVESLNAQEESRIVFGHDLARKYMQDRSAKDKAEFLLWMLGVTDEKPLALVEFEYNFHVELNGLRQLFKSPPSKYYPEAGRSLQRQILEPFIYGRTSIFVDVNASDKFLNDFFDSMITTASPYRNLMYTIFYGAFTEADQARREEILLSLTWSLSQRPAASAAVDPQEQEAMAARYFLEALGLGGKKLAQVLSRTPGVKKAYRDQLALVQHKAKRLPKGIIFDIIAKLPLQNEIVSLDDDMGSASIKVVYKGKLANGRKVAVKVKRPEIDKQIKSDLAFLRRLLDSLQPFLKQSGISVPNNLLDQVEESIKVEIDFRQEAKNTAALRKNVMGRSLPKRAVNWVLSQLIDKGVEAPQRPYTMAVPEVIEVANNTLILEELVEKAISLADEDQITAAQLDLADIEKAAANELWTQIFLDGFYHGDPHAGNILVVKTREGVVVHFIDAGVAFPISVGNRVILAKLFRSVQKRNLSGLENVVSSLGEKVDPGLRDDLKNKVLGVKATLRTKTMNFFQVMEDHQIQLPEDMLNIFRFLGTGGTLFEKSQPEFNGSDQAMLGDVESQMQAAADEPVLEFLRSQNTLDPSMLAESSGSDQQRIVKDTLFAAPALPAADDLVFINDTFGRFIEAVSWIARTQDKREYLRLITDPVKGRDIDADLILNFFRTRRFIGVSWLGRPQKAEFLNTISRVMGDLQKVLLAHLPPEDAAAFKAQWQAWNLDDEKTRYDFLDQYYRFSGIQIPEESLRYPNQLSRVIRHERKHWADSQTTEDEQAVYRRGYLALLRQNGTPGLLWALFREHPAYREELRADMQLLADKGLTPQAQFSGINFWKELYGQIAYPILDIADKPEWKQITEILAELENTDGDFKAAMELHRRQLAISDAQADRDIAVVTQLREQLTAQGKDLSTPPDAAMLGQDPGKVSPQELQKFMQAHPQLKTDVLRLLSLNLETSFFETIMQSTPEVLEAMSLARGPVNLSLLEKELEGYLEENSQDEAKYRAVLGLLWEFSGGLPIAPGGSKVVTVKPGDARGMIFKEPGQRKKSVLLYFNRNRKGTQWNFGVGPGREYFQLSAGKSKEVGSARGSVHFKVTADASGFSIENLRKRIPLQQRDYAMLTADANAFSKKELKEYLGSLGQDNPLRVLTLKLLAARFSTIVLKLDLPTTSKLETFATLAAQINLNDLQAILDENPPYAATYQPVLQAMRDWRANRYPAIPAGAEKSFSLLPGNAVGLRIVDTAAGENADFYANKSREGALTVGLMSTRINAYLPAGEAQDLGGEGQPVHINVRNTADGFVLKNLRAEGQLNWRDRASIDRAMLGDMAGEQEMFYYPLENLPETNPESEEFRQWYASYREKVVQNLVLTQGMVVVGTLQTPEQPVDSLTAYLWNSQNSDKDITKIKELLAARRQPGGVKKVVWEIGGGDTRLAEKIAAQNKEEGVAVITTDLYELDDADMYWPYTELWLMEKLKAQTSGLQNLAVARAESDLLLQVPDNSIDEILLVNPAVASLKTLIVLVKEFGLLKKLVPGGRIIIKADSLVLSYLSLIGDSIAVSESESFSMFGVDLHDDADWAKDRLKGKVFSITPKGQSVTDQAMLGKELPAGNKVKGSQLRRLGLAAAALVGIGGGWLTWNLRDQDVQNFGVPKATPVPAVAVDVDTAPSRGPPPAQPKIDLEQLRNTKLLSRFADFEVMRLAEQKHHTISSVAQDIRHLPAPQNRPYQIYRLHQSQIYFINFASLDEQDRMFDRVALFAEVEGYRGRILNDQEIKEARAKLQKPHVYGGHDYDPYTLADFFTMASAAQAKLNDAELRLKDFLLTGGFIEEKTPGTFTARDNMALLSFVQAKMPEGGRTMRTTIVGDGRFTTEVSIAGADELEIIEHELNHGIYFTNWQYRLAVGHVWEHNLNDEQRELVKAFLKAHDYDVADEDLVRREFAAYFRDFKKMLASLRREYVSFQGKQTPSSKLAAVKALIAKSMISSGGYMWNIQYDTLKQAMKDHNPWPFTEGKVTDLENGGNLLSQGSTKVVFVDPDVIQALRLIEAALRHVEDFSDQGPYQGMEMKPIPVFELVDPFEKEVEVVHDSGHISGIGIETTIVRSIAGTVARADVNAWIEKLDQESREAFLKKWTEFQQNNKDATHARITIEDVPSRMVLAEDKFHVKMTPKGHKVEITPLYRYEERADKQEIWWNKAVDKEPPREWPAMRRPWVWVNKNKIETELMPAQTGAGRALWESAWAGFKKTHPALTPTDAIWVESGYDEGELRVNEKGELMQGPPKAHLKFFQDGEKREGPSVETGSRIMQTFSSGQPLRLNPLPDPGAIRNNPALKVRKKGEASLVPLKDPKKPHVMDGSIPFEPRTLKADGFIPLDIDGKDWDPEAFIQPVREGDRAMLGEYHPVIQQVRSHQDDPAVFATPADPRRKYSLHVQDDFVTPGIFRDAKEVPDTMFYTMTVPSAVGERAYPAAITSGIKMDADNVLQVNWGVVFDYPMLLGELEKYKPTTSRTDGLLSAVAYYLVAGPDSSVRHQVKFLWGYFTSPDINIKTDEEIRAFFRNAPADLRRQGIMTAMTEYLMSFIPAGGQVSFKIANKETQEALQAGADFGDTLLGRIYKKLGFEPVRIEPPTGEGLGVATLEKKQDAALSALWEDSDDLGQHKIAGTRDQGMLGLAVDAKVEGPTSSQRVGGINLDPAMIKIDKNGQGINWSVPLDPQTLKELKIEGLSPVIFQITPVTNLPLLLGVSPKPADARLSLSKRPAVLPED